MRHSQLHSSRDPDEEGALIRSGHLEPRLHHVYSAGGQASVRDIHAQGHLQANQAV